MDILPGEFYFYIKWLFAGGFDHSLAPGMAEHRLSKGDVILLPAGIAHKKVYPSVNFSCVEGYAGSHNYDVNYGRGGELERAKKYIHMQPLPEKDPIYGQEGIMFLYRK